MSADADELHAIGPEFFAGLELTAREVQRVIAPDELRLAFAAEEGYVAFRHSMGAGNAGFADERAWPLWENLPEQQRTAWRVAARAFLQSLKDTAG